MVDHENFLRQALREARRGRGFAAPNPAVGAVVVNKHFVISSGYHHGAGLPHAEVEALSALGADAQGTTVYVTLEPCCHWGRTPPCTQLLIDRKVSRVVYGFADPNPLVAGKGARLLAEAGIECLHLPLPEITAFYRSYAHWTASGLPWVTAKLAMSLDGKIAGPGGSPVPITGEALLKVTHEGRSEADAILTTAKTIVADNPRLDVRLGGEPQGKPLYVLDRHVQLPALARVLSTAKRITLFHSPDANSDRKRALQTAGITLREVKQDETGALDVDEVLRSIGADGCHDLWVEAGGRLFETLMKTRRVNRALLYVAPKWLGESAAPAFTDGAWEWLNQATAVWQSHGRDALCELSW